MTKLKFTGTCFPGLLALMLAGNFTLEPQSLVAQTLVSPAFETDGKETDDKREDRGQAAAGRHLWYRDSGRPYASRSP